MMLLGVLIMLLGLALNSVTTQFITFRTLGSDALDSLTYIASATFVVGFVIGVVGLFRE
jgi:hypothetical protein